MKMKAKFIPMALALAALAFVLPAQGFAAEPKLLIEDVEVFNAPEIEAYAPGLKPMLASRTDGEGYQVVSDSAQGEDAHWKLRTTITKLSNLYSIDAEVSPLVEGAGSVRTYETIASADELMDALEKISTQLRERLEKLVVALPKVAVQPVVVVAAPVVATLPVASPTSVTPVTAVAAQPVALVQPAQKPLSNYKIIASLKGESSVLEAVDLEGDGLVELMVLLEDEVSFFRDEAAGLKLLWKAELDTRGFELKWISTADLDGDGRVELLAAGSDEAKVYTQAYSIADNSFTPLGEKVSGFLRGVDHPDLGRIVIGLPAIGGFEVFNPELSRWSFSGGELVKGEAIATPDAIMPVNIEWVRYGPGAPLTTLVIDQQNRLRIYDEQLDLSFKIEDPVKGTKVRFIGELRSVRNEDDGDLYEVNPPSASYSAPDGRVFTVVHDNISEAGLMPKISGSYSSGKLLSFSWDGLALTYGAATPDFPGYIVDMAIAPGPDGKTKLYALLIKETGLLLVDRDTKVIVFDL